MKLCVALDLPSDRENLMLLESLRGLPLWIKVGLRSYIRDGADFLKRIRAIDSQFSLFLDLKLHDIPNTMADAAFEMAELGVEMLTLHASSGAEAMQEVATRLREHPRRPLLFAVTALTSFDEAGFGAVYGASIEKKALELSKMAASSGMDGVVCSVFESLAIKEATHGGFRTLTPGIRPFGEAVGDQKRVATLQDAWEAKSDFVVIGRPIYKSEDPRALTKRILKEIDSF